MLNERKIRLMTKTAIYEKNKGKGDMKLNMYTGSDYVRFNIIKTVLGATVTAILIFVMFIFYEMEQVMTDVMKLDYYKIGREALTFYIIFVVAYAIIAFFVYQHRFSKAKKRLKKFKMNLEKIDSISKSEHKEA
jgi:lysylphosphatidylglycerol synthetase-like protein (DUF2156 family)